jgi:hypothetical protein
MIVRCGPLHEGDLGPRRDGGIRGFCGAVYDDAKQWTICPHEFLLTQQEKRDRLAQWIEQYDLPKLEAERDGVNRDQPEQ